VTATGRTDTDQCCNKNKDRVQESRSASVNITTIVQESRRDTHKNAQSVSQTYLTLFPQQDQDNPTTPQIQPVPATTNKGASWTALSAAFPALPMPSMAWELRIEANIMGRTTKPARSPVKRRASMFAFNIFGTSVFTFIQDAITARRGPDLVELASIRERLERSCCRKAWRIRSWSAGDDAIRRGLLSISTAST
jgi:hypothetical protein